MVLHRCRVVVSQRERVAAVHEEFVGAAAVLKVVDYLDKKRGEMGEGERGGGVTVIGLAEFGGAVMQRRGSTYCRLLQPWLQQKREREHHACKYGKGRSVG